MRGCGSGRESCPDQVRFRQLAEFPTSQLFGAALTRNSSQVSRRSQCKDGRFVETAMGPSTALRAWRPLWSTFNASFVPKAVSPWRCRRCYSIQSQEEELTRLPDINPKMLSVTKTTTPKGVVPPKELVFGRTFTGKREVMSRHSCCVY